MSADFFGFLDEWTQFNNRNRRALMGRPQEQSPQCDKVQRPFSDPLAETPPQESAQPTAGPSVTRAPKQTRKRGFSALAGDIPADVVDIMTFIRNPSMVEKLGGSVPKGVLLYGPPGTGKTAIARAIAEELEATFFIVSGSEFIEMYVGVGAARVRELFAKGRAAVQQTGRPAVIFIDEIDAIGCKRTSFDDGGAREGRQTLNELLNQMDGFSARENIFVLAATNDPDSLDKALKRPGRFDRMVEVGLPNRSSRLAILRLYAERSPFERDRDEVLDAIAAVTEGFSPAELKSIVHEAIAEAARNHADMISVEHCARAFQKVNRLHAQR